MDELKFKGTNGEWSYQEDSDAYTHIVRCNSGKGKETIYICSTAQSSTPYAEANARLIAVSPDLLSELRESNQLIKEIIESKGG